MLDVTYITLVLLSVLLSMTLHEAMHAYTSHWLGDDTAERQGRLSFNPLAHIDPFATVLLPVLLAVIGLPPFGAAKPVPFNPDRVRYGDFGAALVGLAGPITNLILAFIGFTAYMLGVNQGIGGLFLTTFVTVNLGFFVFNILPIPPLDGSRALYAIAPQSIQRLMEWIEQYGLAVVFIVVLVFNAQLGHFMQAAITGLLRLFSLPFAS